MRLTSLCLTVLPLAVSGCALTAGLDAAGGGGGLVTALDNKLTLPLQFCTGLILETNGQIKQLNAGLVAQAQAPTTVMVPTQAPVTVTPSPTGPVVSPAPPVMGPASPVVSKPPAPIPAPKPIPTVP